MLRRVFVAINLPEEIKDELSQFQRKWPSLPCRWLDKESFHLTLAFLGNRGDEELKKIFEAVKKTTKEKKPFSLSLNRISYGPPKMKPPRLVWAQGESSEQLLRLKKDLDRELLQAINFSAEKRKFSLHITLARIKKWNWQRINPEERPEVNLPISLEIPVNSIEVMESQLKRRGAEYIVLETCSLKRET